MVDFNLSEYMVTSLNCFFCQPRATLLSNITKKRSKILMLQPGNFGIFAQKMTESNLLNRCGGLHLHQHKKNQLFISAHTQYQSRMLLVFRSRSNMNITCKVFEDRHIVNKVSIIVRQCADFLGFFHPNY